MLHASDLDVVLRQIMARWDVPGLAVGIVQGGDIVYARGLGVRSLATRAPVTLDSMFCVQSVSKCFVAVAVMQMAESGALDLDAPLVRYLPYFRMADERYRRITIRQALSHTSGMPDIDEIDYVTWMAHPEYDDGAAERFVRGLSDLKLLANPGERFAYSNIAYDVLGDLLAKVSGNSFEGLMRERVLIPAGMPHSTFVLADVPADLLAWPHLRSPEMRVNPTYPYHRADAPASFLHTTVEDLCDWAIANLNRGSYLGQRLLSPAAYDLMWTAVAQRGSQRPSLYEEMGLGWTLGHYGELKTVSHGGGGFGGTAFLLLLPEIAGAVVVLCNQESGAHFQAVAAATDALLGREPRAGKVSSTAPLSRALAEGGIDAAHARYADIRANEEEYHCGEDDLLDLALQLFTARQVDLAIAVLGLNTRLYPATIESYLQQAKLYLHQGDQDQARASLRQALSIEPDNATAARLLQIV